jgi:hypothetical protein
MKKVITVLPLIFLISISCNNHYQYKKEIQEGLFLTKVDGKFGLVDTAGNILIPNEYDTLDFFGSKGYSVKEGKMGLIDREGKIIIPNEYELLDFTGSSDGVSVKDGKVGRIDMFGNIIIPNEYESIEWNGSIGISVKDGKSGIIDRKGNVLISNDYDSIEFVMDWIEVTKGGDTKKITFQELYLAND